LCSSDLTFSIVSGPIIGDLGLILPGNIVRYSPRKNLNGTDSFVFKVDDGKGGTSTATVAITVNAINDAPLAPTVNVNTDEDKSIQVTFAGTDVEQDTLIYSVAAVGNGGPSRGDLDAYVGNPVTYTPRANLIGLASFTYAVFAGSTTTNGTVNITVISINDAPTATRTILTTPENKALSITLTGSDIDGDNLSFAVTNTAGLLNGSLSPMTQCNLVTYTPTSNITATVTDSFEFTVSDGVALPVTTGTMTIEVTRVNEVPIISSISPLTAEDKRGRASGRDQAGRSM